MTLPPPYDTATWILAVLGWLVLFLGPGAILGVLMGLGWPRLRDWIITERLMRKHGVVRSGQRGP